MASTTTQRQIEVPSPTTIQKPSSDRSIEKTKIISTTARFALTYYLSPSLIHVQATGQSSYAWLPTQSYTPSIPSVTQIHGNKTVIIIGVVSAITGIILLAVICCTWLYCRRRKRRAEHEMAGRGRAGSWIEMTMNGQPQYRRLLDKDNLIEDFDEEDDDNGSKL
jgi:hypothetical protein